MKGLEPACWGSGELPLIPPGLARSCGGILFDGFVRNKSSLRVAMSALALPEWRTSFGDARYVASDDTLIDLVVAEISRVYESDPDRLDVPFLSVPLDTYAGASFLPFEVRTWQLIADAGAVGDLDVMVLLTGTFRELMDRLGDARAALDVAVTGPEWIVANDNGSHGFVVPSLPSGLDDAVRLLRERSFRCEGQKMTATNYTGRWAQVMGLRRGVGCAKRWTLDACATKMGVTRERVRQVEKTALWVAEPRMWGRPAVLEELNGAVLDSSDEEIVLSTGEAMSRDDAIVLLVGFGYPAEDFEGPWTIENEMELLGVKPSAVRQVAYAESERTGFMTMDELRFHVADRFPVLVGEMFDEVIDSLVVMGDLPHGYVYLEGSRGSALKGWLASLLSTLGPQTFDEAFGAMQRHFKARRSGLVFPPKAVIEAFVSRDGSFWLSDGVVGLCEPVSRELAGIEKWVQDTICSSSGQVIHRTELWSKARDAGVKGGTLSMYTSYSLYFKPVPGGFVTMTGMHPADVMCELARKRASAIRVPTRRGKVEVSDGVVTIVVQVGNDLIDGGVFSSTREIRTMLSGQKFRALTNGHQYGNISWSGAMMIGFGGVLREMSAQPGDTVMFSFSLEDAEMVADFAAE